MLLVSDAALHFDLLFIRSDCSILLEHLVAAAGSSSWKQELLCFKMAPVPLRPCWIGVKHTRLVTWKGVQQLACHYIQFNYNTFALQELKGKYPQDKDIILTATLFDKCLYWLRFDVMSSDWLSFLQGLSAPWIWHRHPQAPGSAAYQRYCRWAHTRLHTHAC